MTYGSVCSGIEAASVAWEPLGWRPVWFSEVDKYCSALLAHHYPGVTNHGDFTRIGDDAGPIGLLVGGTPCQDFSVAGLRAGMDSARGNLTLEFVRLAGHLRPRWVAWENVPGVLSIDGGRAFGAFLGGLAQLGYGYAYRVLDAQFFGVPQRRRRVFVIGYFGDWRPPAAVLFERHGLSGYPPPRREAREDVAQDVIGSLTGSGRGVERTGESRGQDPVVPCYAPEVAYGLNAHPSRRYDVQANETFTAHCLRADGFDAGEDGTGRGTPLVPIGFYGNDSGADAGQNIAPTLRSISGGGNRPSVAFQEAQTGVHEYDTAGTLRSNGPGHDPVGTRVRSGMAVRRLTPRECERLQGFPDDYTLIPNYSRKRTGEFGGNRGTADGPRYRALGNSMAVPVMRWIGERIEIVERIIQ